MWEIVVASWSIDLRQSAGTIPVLVGWPSLSAWSATACYAVGCQTTTACCEGCLTDGRQCCNVVAVPAMRPTVASMGSSVGRTEVGF